MSLSFRPLSASTWADFETLFGERGACGGCWCMTPRLRSGDYERQKGEGNKKAMHELAQRNEHTGILAYEGHTAVGWCAVAPREKFLRLENSRILQRVDEQPVWSVTCLFIMKAWRRKGLSTQLINAAAAYARKNGAKILEGYPVLPKQGEMPDVFAYSGLYSSFIKAGFSEVARRSETRPIVRRTL